MGLWEFLQQWPRGRFAGGVVASLLLHVLLVTGMLWGLAPELEPRWKTRPGDTLIVELPRPEEPAAAGPLVAPPAPARPEPRPAPPPPPRQAPAPPPRPAPKVAAAPPAPRAPAPPAPAVEPAPRVAEPAPAAPTPAPRVSEPAPRAAEAVPPEPAPAAAEPAPRVTTPAPPRPAAPAAGEPRRGAAEHQVASLPPAEPPLPSLRDVRAALRAGAAGRGQGRGGIEGDPIPLDSPDARYSDYLLQVKRRIQAKWGIPCVRNAQTRECELYETSLEVEFGILKDGRVQFVDVVRFSDHALYDDYATNAIKLASPFPPVPAVMLQAVRAGSTGIPIRARFNYLVESSLTNLLR